MRLLSITIVALLGLVWCVQIPVKVETPMDGYSYRTLNGMAMYKPKDSPISGPPGEGRSFIQFKNFKVHRTDINDKFEEAAIQLVVIPDFDINSIGVEGSGQSLFCCNPTLLDTKLYSQCKEESQLNKLISTLSSYENSENGNYHLVKFNKGQKEVTVPEWTYSVKESQIHIIAVAVCDIKVGEVTLEGETVWMNPYGHLPAQLYGFLPFYGWMCVIYLAACCIWFLLNVIHRKDLLHVQNCISLVLIICMVEMLAWYFDYLHLNTEGIRQNELFIFGIIVSVSRRTIARMLVVAVSMGYGVVRATFGDQKRKILLLGFTYWVFAICFEALVHYSQVQEVSPTIRMILTPPVAILDGYFWWWIFSSLSGTIADLKRERQLAKLVLFEKFSWCLGLSLSLAFVFACYQLYYVWMKQYLENWRIMWIMEVGFWQILFTIVFFSIMVLWRPSKHSSEYAYSQQIATEDMDDAEMFEDTLGKPDTAEADDNEFEIGDDEDNF